MPLIENIPGATPIDDLSGLIPSHITTHQQLNEWEAANILQAVKKYLAKRKELKISLEWLKEVHQAMFGETWEWAGKLRKKNYNLGIDWHNISEQMKILIDDLKYWQTEKPIMSVFSQSVRLHHRLVKIHPFVNGNGRHARLVADIFLFANNQQLPVWPDEKLPSYFIKTYGCAMNDADSAKLAAVLESAGYQKAVSEKSADIVLVNTCVVRQHAEDRAAWFIKSSKGLRKKNPSVKIGVCGCLVTEPGRDLRKMFPHVDFFIPPNSPNVLLKYLDIHSSFVIDTSSLVTITHGCNNFCSYCIVPYVRGREYSRPMDEVLAEIKQKIEQGAKEITLLGQNVNSYEPGLANLLNAIHSFVPPKADHSNLVIHFMTSHPKDMSDEIIEAVHEFPYVAKDFHLPIQSGDDGILKKMNRGYTVDYYQDRVKKIRELMPKARITTDIMVGFPGETEEQFQNTLKILKQIHFRSVNMFAYSARPETAAAKMPDQLPQEVIQRRLQELIKTNRKILA